MKKVIRCKSNRAINSTHVKWRVVHLPITLYIDSGEIAASTSVEEGPEQFLDLMLEHVMNAGFLPYLSVEVMKKKFRSPFSESEYYVFLRIEDDEKIKLILDIRYSQHTSIQHGKVNSHNRHINYMRKAKRKEIDDDIGMHADEADVAFIDVAYLANSKLVEIDIDKQQNFSVKEALKVLDSKLQKLIR